MHLKWYLPRFMLNIVSRELSCVRFMLQKLRLASNLDYIVKPAKLCVICTNVGALWCLQMMALLKSLGSGHTLRVPQINIIQR